MGLRLRFHLWPVHTPNHEKPGNYRPYTSSVGNGGCPYAHAPPCARSFCNSHTIGYTGFNNVWVTGGMLSLACFCTSDYLRKVFKIYLKGFQSPKKMMVAVATTDHSRPQSLMYLLFTLLFKKMLIPGLVNPQGSKCQTEKYFESSLSWRSNSISWCDGFLEVVPLMSLMYLNLYLLPTHQIGCINSISKISCFAFENVTNQWLEEPPPLWYMRTEDHLRERSYSPSYSEPKGK